jgi:flavin reductase (DIM6/NTAB) family NADH-FMN oxidoreductase RutF
MEQKAIIPADGEWVDRGARDFSGSPSDRIGGGWMLITAGDSGKGPGHWNTMTASWGGLGVLWGRDVAFMFIRPSRHTFPFANAAPLFTLSFFDQKWRGALEICGAQSGRDTDKAAETGLTPIGFSGFPGSAVAFREAREVFVCRKLYTHDFDPAAFLDAPSIEKSYQGKDYHRMFIGEILGLKIRRGNTEAP